MSASSNTPAWWDSLHHTGLLIAPARLVEHFGAAPTTVSDYLTERLRDAVTRLRERERGPSMEQRAAFVDRVVEDLCKLTPSEGFTVAKGADLDASWTHRSLTGEAVKPRRLVRGPHEVTLPIFVTDDARVGVHQGRRSVALAVEWLRAAGQPMAVITNAFQWRLVHVGPDWEASCDWDIDRWFEAGRAGAQVVALRALLSPRALTPPSRDARSPLRQAVEESRRGQAELGALLGERVRQGVELLIRAHAPGLDALEQADGAMRAKHVYRAATRVVMRLVVLLFAEARELLPRANPIYQSSYGLQGLRDQLDRVTPERLRERVGAWPRVLALFRLVYLGSPHAALPVPRYGGGLFRPGAPDARDPVDRALARFESAEDAPHDDVVRQLLDLLCRTRVRIRQGRATTWVPWPVDFSDLSSEYIGILYEALLDFELRRAPPGDPMVFLAVGDEPCLPLSRLEAMDGGALKGLLAKLAKAGGDEGDDPDDAPDPAPPTEALAPEEVAVDEPDDAPVLEDDVAAHAQARALAWARKAVEAAGLVPKPRRGKAAPDLEALRDLAARRLLRRVVLPGERFLVRWGGTRKGSGSFYTRPELAVPLVQRTLRPLTWTPPVTAGGTPDEGAPAEQWSPRTPREILDLKVCDPAMGSGSFLIAALRHLTDALFAALHRHGAITVDGDHARVTLPHGDAAVGDPAEELLPGRPGEAAFEARLRARLKRRVVLHCLYGVDLDPLAVELARVALWVETMDEQLPFEFLDHRLRRGNALVGAWLDRVDDPPLLAWEREGGDAKHDTAVHLEKGERTGALKKRRGDVLARARDWLSGQARLHFDAPSAASLATLREGLQRTLDAMASLPLHDPEAREALWRRGVTDNTDLHAVVERMNTWCAQWFWPVDQLGLAPWPGEATAATRVGRDLVADLATELGFFHWELAFADVFTREGAGFDAIVGNPPWDIAKPRSQEFFSNLDPLYRTYGKQEALDAQRSLFAARPDEERAWVDYNARFNALANWVRCVGSPFGDGVDQGKTLPFGKTHTGWLKEWERARAKRPAYSDRAHPFLRQGGGDVNTYKLFLEASHNLLRDGGTLGMLTPSGIYSDKGSEPLRALFLDRCRWAFLYAFQNERFVFDNIHHSFKVAAIGVVKGGATDAVQSRFRLGPSDSPERAELQADVSDGARFLPMTRATVARFSPKTRSLLEIREKRDLQLLERIYDHAVLLGDDGADGWGIEYAREFDMTNDSRLFPPRPKWEADGYRPDEYSRWIKPTRVHAAPGRDEPGWIALRDGSGWVREEEIEGVALPLYQGVMINILDPFAAGWTGGAGNQAEWERIDSRKPHAAPQFLMGAGNALEGGVRPGVGKVAFRDVARATDSRTVIASLVAGVPCGNVLGVLQAAETLRWTLAGVMGTFLFDWVARQRLTGTHLNLFVIEEFPLPKVRTPNEWSAPVAWHALVACGGHLSFSAEWWRANHLIREKGTIAPVLQARTPFERARVRAVLEALVASAFGLDEEHLRHVLQDTDHPVAAYSDRATTESFDTKGFWRVDRDVPPELRHAVLTQVAFADLMARVRAHDGDRAKGVEDFLAQHDGDGWQLPETLRLADYGLGHDARAKEAQPVAAALGPRWLDWQREQSAEESWRAYRRHARNLLGEVGFAALERELSEAEATAAPSPSAAAPQDARPRDLFGAPVAVDLFGNPVEPKGKKRRRT